MSKAMTGSFYLSETINLPPANPQGDPGRIQAAIDLSAYINVPTGQAIAIDEVDFLWQRDGDYGGDAHQFLAGTPGALTIQLTDLNPGSVFVRGDNQSLVASGTLNIDADGGTSQFSDVYPDNYGPSGLSDMFLCVNDQLFIVAGNDGQLVGAGDLYCTVRVRCRVVKLSNKDWMAIAIQSTASDN